MKIVAKLEMDLPDGVTDPHEALLRLAIRLKQEAVGDGENRKDLRGKWEVVGDE